MTISDSTYVSTEGFTRSNGPRTTPASSKNSPTVRGGARCNICFPSTAMVAATARSIATVMPRATDATGAGMMRSPPLISTSSWCNACSTVPRNVSACTTSSPSITVSTVMTHDGDSATIYAITANTMMARTRSSNSSRIVSLRDKTAQFGPNFLLSQFIQRINELDHFRELLFGNDSLAVQSFECGQKLQFQSLHMFEHRHTVTSSTKRVYSL